MFLGPLENTSAGSEGLAMIIDTTLSVAKCFVFLSIVFLLCEGSKQNGFDSQVSCLRFILVPTVALHTFLFCLMKSVVLIFISLLC